MILFYQSSSYPVFIKIFFCHQDYDRDPDILKRLDPFEVLALCCEFQIVPYRGFTEDGFKKLFKEILELQLQGRMHN